MSTSRQAEATADRTPARAIGSDLASRPWIAALMLCLVIGVLARLSLAVLGPTNIAPVWPVNGVILAVLLQTKPGRRPLMLAAGYLGVILGGYANGGALRSTIGLGACDVLELMASVAIIEHFIKKTTDLSRPRDVMVCGAAALVSAMLSAVGAGLVLGWLGRPDLGRATIVWTLANGLGQMIGAPVILALAEPGRLSLSTFKPFHRSALSFGLLTAVVLGVFGQSRSGLPFLVFAPLLLVVFQLETLGAALGVLLTAILAVVLTVGGYGPLTVIAHTPVDRVLVLQVFLLACVVVNFPVAAALADRRRALEVLAISETRLRLLSAHSRDVVIRVGLDRRIIDASPSCRHYGYEPDDLIGRTGAELSHPDDRAAVSAMFDDLLRDPGRRSGAVRQWRVRTQSGDWLWMEGALTAVLDARGEVKEGAIVMRDISEHKASAEALAESEANYRLLADSAPDVIVRVRMGGVITYLSRSVEQVTGYGISELIGTNLYDLVHPDDRASVGDQIRAYLVQPAGTRAVLEYRLVRKDGAVVWIEANPYRLVDQDTGEILGLGGFLRDVTDRRMMEDDLRRQRAEAEASEVARAAAEEAARESMSELTRVARLLSVGEFATSIAHELNQPLAAIVTNSDTSLRWLAKAPPNLDEARAAIGRTLRDADRAAAVISRTRAMLSKRPAALIRLDINDCVEEVLAFTDTELRRNRVTVRRQFQRPSPMTNGDRVQLQQVLLNLVRNGMEAMTETADRARVLSVRTLTQDDGEVMVEVEDSGVGLTQDAADHLFDSFFTTKIGGIGLGLPISRSIVETHGGRIWASTAPEGGAIFRFTLQGAEASL